MTKIHAIHGFLGLPSDWDQFGFSQLVAYNLFNSSISPSKEGFWEWAKRFNQRVESDGIMMGYSLGGRLGMHALLEQPHKWKAGIFISSHTGIKQHEEKSFRLSHDLKWALRFKSEDWNELVRDWNAQPVFGGIHPSLQRKESDFCREYLSLLLKYYSRGEQEDLSNAIQKIQVPILWVGGENDVAFEKAAKDLNFAHPQSKIHFIKGAAHRVPWEQPELFKTIIHSFLQEVL